MLWTDVIETKTNGVCGKGGSFAAALHDGLRPTLICPAIAGQAPLMIQEGWRVRAGVVTGNIRNARAMDSPPSLYPRHFPVSVIGGFR